MFRVGLLTWSELIELFCNVDILHNPSFLPDCLHIVRKEKTLCASQAYLQTHNGLQQTSVDESVFFDGL